MAKDKDKTQTSDEGAVNAQVEGGQAIDTPPFGKERAQLAGRTFATAEELAVAILALGKSDPSTFHARVCQLCAELLG